MSSRSRSDHSQRPRLPREGHAVLPEFELAPELVHLNHGSYGAVPRQVTAEQQRWRSRIESDPTGFFQEVYPVEIRRSAGIAAVSFGGAAKDWVFCENATVAANSVFASFPLAAGDEILATSHGYGAVLKAARVWAGRRQATLKLVALPPIVDSDEEIIELIARGYTDRTRLLIIDHITSATAIVLPVAELTSAAHAAGIAVFIDGAHAPGQLPLDVPSIAADWYTGNAHKWSFTPRGCGLLWTSPDRQAETLPAVLSHGTESGYTAAFDWTGTRDVTPWLCLEAGAECHRLYGGLELVERNRRLTAEAADLLKSVVKGTPSAPAQMRGSMVSLRLGRASNAAGRALAIRGALRKSGIVAPVSALGESVYLRVSTQVYNEFSDYERCALALARLPEIRFP